MYQFFNPTKSFTHEDYPNNTELSQEYWEMRSSNFSPKGIWNIVRESAPHNLCKRKCYLCQIETLAVDSYKERSYLNKRSDLVISVHKWSTTQRVRKMGVIYMQSWKQCALPVIITMALWQLMHMMYAHVFNCMSCHKAIVVITGRAHRFYNCIYIFIHGNHGDNKLHI